MIRTSGQVPIRVLELRSVWGTGGGPDKTILLGTARTDRTRYAITVCYIRDARDPAFGITARYAGTSIDYVEVVERHSFDWRIWPELRKLVRARGIDIVHAHDYKTDLLALLLAKFDGAIPLSTAHGWSGESRKDRWYYAVDRRLLARFPMVVAVSRPIEHQLLRAGCQPERVQVIPNGIDHERFRRNDDLVESTRESLGIEPSTLVVGSVGRLETVKCYDVLVRAFASVHREHPRTRLLIVGDGPCREALTNLVQALGLERVIHLVGHRHDVSALYHAMTVFVQSSRSEGSPNAVLEAMAFEVPVVASNVGGTADFVTDRVHGLLVPPEDEGALSTAILEVLSDSDLACRRAGAARRRVETDLSFATRMERVEAVYDHLMARSGANRHVA